MGHRGRLFPARFSFLCVWAPFRTRIYTGIDFNIILTTSSAVSSTKLGSMLSSLQAASLVLVVYIYYVGELLSLNGRGPVILLLFIFLYMQYIFRRRTRAPHLNYPLAGNVPPPPQYSASEEMVPAYPMLIDDADGVTDLSNSGGAVGVMFNGVALFRYTNYKHFCHKNLRLEKSSDRRITFFVRI